MFQYLSAIAHIHPRFLKVFRLYRVCGGLIQVTFFTLSDPIPHVSAAWTVSILCGFPWGQRSLMVFFVDLWNVLHQKLLVVAHPLGTTSASIGSSSVPYLVCA